MVPNPRSKSRSPGILGLACKCRCGTSMDGDKNTLTHLHMSVSFICTLNTGTPQQLNRCGRERHSRLEPTAEAAYLVTALTSV